MSNERSLSVAINTLSHVTGGGITYFNNVLPRIGGDENEYLVLVPSDRDKISRPAAENLQFVETSFPTHNVLLRLVYEQFVLPVLLWYWGVDVLYSPADITPLFAPCPSLLAVRNPNPYFDAPELDRTRYRRIKFKIQRWLTWLSARRAEHVFFVSEFSRNVSNRYLDVDERKLSVVHHGIDRTLFEEPGTTDDARLHLTVEASSKYILCVSTINEHKNYETLLRGYARLPEELKAEYDLLVAGRRSAPTYYEKLLDVAAAEGIEDDVVFLGEVDYSVIPYLYENASLYVLPSKLETFGHTLVEAMASGVPIVAADATCIPEITDGAAALFDPDEPSDLAETLTSVLDDGDRRDELVAAGQRRVGDFSWDETVERTKALLRAVHEGGGEESD